MIINFNNGNYGFRFHQWDIYKDVGIFRNEINQLLKVFPKEEKYVLVDQAKRALNSVVLNIAEIVNQNADKDTKIYINRSHCLSDEVVVCLDCALDDGYITKEKNDKVLQKISSLAKRLKGFTRQLSVKSQY